MGAAPGSAGRNGTNLRPESQGSYLGRSSGAQPRRPPLRFAPNTLDRAFNVPLERLYADLELSGREDLNLRPFGPEPNALPGCATPRAERSDLPNLGASVN